MNLTLAVELCKRFEGLSLKPYLCPAGVPTIGYGTVYKPDGSKVTMDHPPITKELAERWLLDELAHKYAPSVARLCPVLLVDERRFNAIVDFCYNLGPGNLQVSTLRKCVNARDWEGAKYQIKRWNKGGGRVLPGLVRRRQAEADLL